jgi:nucleotide-binding universal stress UspA family protein
MYKHILVPLDGSELSDYVIPHLGTVVKGCRKPPRVTLLRVVEPSKMAFGSEAVTPMAVQQLQAMFDWQREDARKYLARTQRKLQKGGIDTDTVSLEGLPADVIIEYAEKNKIDLLIMSTHGRSGISRAVFGSVAEKVLHGLCIPVLMIRAPGCGLQFKRK